jgi:hypothetical protein
MKLEKYKLNWLRKGLLNEKALRMKGFWSGVVMSGLEPPTHGFSVRCSTT